MTPVRLNPLDSAWLFTESRATPNHVGGLLQFRLPERAPKDYLRKLMAGFRNHREFAPPWMTFRPCWRNHSSVEPVP